MKETPHFCEVNSLGMGGYFPSVSHTSFYGTETHICRVFNLEVDRILI